MAKSDIDISNYHYFSPEDNLPTQPIPTFEEHPQLHSNCKYYSEYILTNQPDIHFNSFKCDNCRSFSNWEPNTSI